MSRYVRWICVCLALAMLAGCATLYPDFESPTVTVNTIRLLPTGTIAPQFEIGLHIVNPNRGSLRLHGIAYTLSLEGFKILTGVANDLPTIAGYGQEDISLIATTNLISSIRLVSDLLYRQRDAIAYDLDAKLDLGGIMPALHINESGAIDITAR
jgi:LEA14-like dessication related protein